MKNHIYKTSETTNAAWFNAAFKVTYPESAQDSKNMTEVYCRQLLMKRLGIRDVHVLNDQQIRKLKVIAASGAKPQWQLLYLSPHRDTMWRIFEIQLHL